MNFVKSLYAAALVSAMAPVAANTVYDFQTVTGADATTYTTCTGSDQCAIADGGTMTFYGGAVGATGNYYNGSAVVGARSMLDNFSDRPGDHSEWRWVGLGVYHKSPLDNKDDNITKDERLVLTFKTAVVLTDVFLRAEGHYANFAATGAKFGVQSDGGIVDFSLTTNQNLYNITNAGLGASTTWTFYGYSNDDMKQYYVSSVTAVPEPEAYGLALAGMGVVGFMMRRRKQRA
ncbi:MAG: PEP-CTERM sorting domain-containing protein [Rhizobacter sp.]|nr:PEP-CTERM sorting domain-containing protein [Rhizobacter sp.]